MDRRVLMAGAALVAGASVLPAAAQDTGVSRSIIDRFAVTLSAHDIAAFADLFAEDYVNHQFSAAAPPPPPGKTPKQATVAFFAARLAGIPDLQVLIEASVASPESVAASFVYTGTHNGPLFGVAPTGRPLRFTSCDIFGLRGGRFVEHWGMGDIAGVLAQIRA
jgi:ketosteroid isomerase-like protein